MLIATIIDITIMITKRIDVLLLIELMNNFVIHILICTFKIVHSMNELKSLYLQYVS